MHVAYRICFEESWRVGSGEAAGPFLDSLVRRDGHGLPFVPGTTMRGLVADALRELCQALGVGRCEGTVARQSPSQAPASLCGVTRPGLCPLCALTGSPHTEGQVRWSPARLALTAEGREVEGPVARQALADEAASTPGLLTRSHPHTSIERRSGRAADEKLFSLEEASARLVVQGRADVDPAVAAEHVALLAAALRFIREIGGGRRRGLGGCRIHLDGSDLAPRFTSWQEAVRHVETLRPGAARQPLLQPAAPPPAAPLRPPPPLVSPVLRVDATVIGEVSLGRRPESGNQISGLPFLPGSTLRGGLAGRWRGERESAEFHRCFVSGRIRFGFLYPRSGAATALPAARSLHTCKLRPGRRSDLGHGLVDLLYHRDADRCPECQGRLVPWGERFGEELPALALSPHNRIEAESQTVGVGGLFAYEALAEGTQLRGYVRADEAGDLATLLAGIGLGEDEGFRLRVGRRKGSLGFLDCTLTGFGDERGSMGLFPELPPLPAPWPPGSACRLDLLTPAIVLDRHLRFRRHLTPADFGLGREDFVARFGGTATVAGWNAAHRLPKADCLAVAAGSSCLLEEVTSEELEILRRTVLAGIGLRREEGFGAFAVSAVTAADRERR